MALTLNHYSIRSADLDACRHFYTAVLGLQVGRFCRNRRVLVRSADEV